MSNSKSRKNPAWRMAESLEVLRRQLNAAFPNRSKASDGGIGDAAHASRGSDHNPWVKDSKGAGVVTARDFTHDPKGGLDCHRLAAALIKSRDPRIKYIIWNGQICSSKVIPWQWRPYTGKNAHRHHLHISVMSEPGLYDAPGLWNVSSTRAFADQPVDQSTAAAVTPGTEPLPADPPANVAPTVDPSPSEPVVLTPTEADDDLLTQAFDKSVSADEIRTSVKGAAPTLAGRLWRYLARPVLWLYAALEAGNVAAWLGVAVAVVIALYLLYRNRAKIFRFWEKLKTKITS